MRIRKKRWAESEITNNEFVIKNATDCKGKWRELFESNGAVCIELGMGKGDFIIEKASYEPLAGFVGIERQESVFATAAKKIRAQENIRNIKLVMEDAGELTSFFDEDEVDRIYINFCDPWPKRRYEKRRLTHSGFLTQYSKILKNGGKIEFKTDSRELFEFSKTEFIKKNWRIERATTNLHNESDISGFSNVMTEYEKKFSALGTEICQIIAVNVK